MTHHEIFWAKKTGIHTREGIEGYERSDEHLLQLVIGAPDCFHGPVERLQYTESRARHFPAASPCPSADRAG
jgi:hypothetical protein